MGPCFASPLSGDSACHSVSDYFAQFCVWIPSLALRSLHDLAHSSHELISKKRCRRVSLSLLGAAGFF
jgi:hypothetical protein